MSGAYREAALTCPGCGEMLEHKLVGESVIDVCPMCHGIWVDWFDGELTEMVRGGAPHADAPPAATAGRDGACPRCRATLVHERHRESSVEVRRCADCAGVFVPRGSIASMVSHWPSATAPAGSEGALGRLAAVLRRWLEWDPKW